MADAIAPGLRALIVPIDSVREDPNNARLHSERNLQAIASSLRQFGQQKPVVAAADGTVIAGNGVLLAARRLGWRRLAVARSRLSAAALRAYAIADNRTGELSEWDEDRLAQELLELREAAFDLESLGFSEGELQEILEGQDSAEDPPAPPLPRDPVSRPGAIYRLGAHRLLVGDATKKADLRRLMAGRQADLLLTDPPYNVAYEGGTAEALRIANDSMEDSAFRQFLTDAFTAADAVLRPGAVFYVWHADSEAFNFRAACRAAGWQVRQCLVWMKNALVLGRQDYQWRHEPCLYGWKAGAGHTWNGGRRQSTALVADGPWQPVVTGEGVCVLIDGGAYLVSGEGLAIRPLESTVLCFDRPARNADHPTMKPVELFIRQIRNSTDRGGLVLDPFAGSGTTVLAAERTGRAARVLELDPRYADVIRRRWAEVVAGEGCPWEDLTPEAGGEKSAAPPKPRKTPRKRRKRICEKRHKRTCGSMRDSA